MSQHRYGGRSTGGNGDDDAYQAAPAEHACSVWLKERANENRCSRIRSELTWPPPPMLPSELPFFPDIGTADYFVTLIRELETRI